jgi:hypothetical protein
LYCGHPEKAARGLPGAMKLAEKVGHYGVLLALKMASTTLTAARGELSQAEREMEEAWNFGEKHNIAFNFVSDTLRGGLAYLRGNLSEAERWLCYRQEHRTHNFGWKDASLFALLAESNPNRAWNVWNARRWNFPRGGQPNPNGAWFALERSVIGLALLGRKEEAAGLRTLTEELVRTGVWMSRGLYPFRTAAGVAAACAGDWSAAEQHHLTAIHQTEAAPYRVSQPQARERYAQMLLDRNASGDAEKARGLLREALAIYQSIGMSFHAQRTSGRLATL